jgi:hypothetical protein
MLLEEREKWTENSAHNWIRSHDSDDYGSILGQTFFFFLYEHITTDPLTDWPAFYRMVIDNFFPAVRLPQREADHALPSTS